MKKMMRCHPIVLLAGLLTVVRAQGQSVARHSSSYLILTLRFPTMAQLCLTLRSSPALAPPPPPPSYIRCRFVLRRNFFSLYTRGIVFGISLCKDRPFLSPAKIKDAHHDVPLINVSLVLREKSKFKIYIEISR